MVKARRNPDFLVRARTDAYATHGVEEVIRRLNLYAEAGADVLYADAITEAKDIERVTRNVVRPFAVNMGFGIRSRPTTPLISPRQLQEMGVAQVSYARLLSAAALRGMTNAMDVLLDKVIAKNETVERPDLLVSFVELNEIMGMRDLEELENYFNS
jgi:2-methylisocitrate lyase-like PEP mutase family enzyme